MFDTLALRSDISIGDAGVTAIFGYAVVFCGLAMLMGVLYILAAFFKSRDKKAKDAAAAVITEITEEKAVAVKAPEPVLAPGSAGHIKLHDVSDKDAAMIMAIVADKMQKPINELHFISIKEVK